MTADPSVFVMRDGAGPGAAIKADLRRGVERLLVVAPLSLLKFDWLEAAEA